MVQTADQAISIARKACLADDKEVWTAKFRYGLWEAEHIFENTPTACNWIRVEIWAEDGRAKECQECAVVTSSM